MTVRARLFDADGHDRDVTIGRDPIPKPGQRRLLWIDLDERTERDLRASAEALGIERALFRLKGQPDWEGEVWRISNDQLGSGFSAEVSIRIARDPAIANHRVVTAVAEYPSDVAAVVRVIRQQELP